MPESEITELRIKLKTYRNRVIAGNASSPYYNDVVIIFEDYLHKLYQFGRVEQLQSYLTDILNSTHLKELIQQDLVDISRSLTNRLSPEELAQIKQQLGEKAKLFSQIRLDGSGHWLNLEREIQSLPAGFNGDAELGQRYFTDTTVFWAELRQYEKSLVNLLQNTIDSRLKEMKDNIIKMFLIGVLILIVLSGMIILLRKTEPKRA